MAEFLYQKEIEQIQSHLKANRESIDFQPATVPELNYLKGIVIPDSVLEFYRYANPSTYVEIGGVRVLPVVDLREENENAVPGYIISPFGFIVFASTVYGDAYCLDIIKTNELGETPVVIASHDEIEEGMVETQIRIKVKRISNSFKEFLRKFLLEELPKNYYDTIES